MWWGKVDNIIKVLHMLDTEKGDTSDQGQWEQARTREEGSVTLAGRSSQNPFPESYQKLLLKHRTQQFSQDLGTIELWQERPPEQSGQKGTMGKRLLKDVNRKIKNPKFIYLLIYLPSPLMYTYEYIHK